MRIFVYVEGPSDVLALKELFSQYTQRLRAQGHGLEFIHLKNKANFLAKIGPRAARVLAANVADRVVALPDLYPNKGFAEQYGHGDLRELCDLMARLVSAALGKDFGLQGRAVHEALTRFYPSALKHDLEMLLLVAWRLVRKRIGSPSSDSGWRHPAEEQNQQHPPKRIVEQIFLRSGRAYRDTKDAPAALRSITNVREDVLYERHGQLECPVFKEFLDWLGEQTGVMAYEC